MRKFNFKFVAILLVSIVVVVTSVHLLHGFNVGRTGKLLLTSAELAEKEGETDKAIRLYVTFDKQSGEQDPVGIRSAAELALVRAKEPTATGRELRQAYGLMENALRKDPENDELRRDFVRFLIQEPRFPETRWGTALVELQQMRDEGTRDVELLFLSARCNEALGHYPEAIEALSELTGCDPSAESFGSVKAQDPQNLEAFSLLATIVRERNRGVELSEAIIDRMIATNPDNGDAYLQRGIFRRTHNTEGAKAEREARLADSDADIRRAYELSPESADVLLEASQLAIREKEFDRAVELVQAGIEKYPEDFRFVPQMAIATRLSGKSNEAIAFAKKARETHPENSQLLMLLGELQLHDGRTEGAVETVKEMQKLQFPKPLIELNQARIDMLRGDTRVAAQALERARKKLEKSPRYRQMIDALLADAYQRLGQPDRQIEALDRMLSYQPNSESALRSKVAALQKLGRIDEAVATMQTIGRVKGSAEFMADPALSNAFLQLSRAQLRRNPDDTRLQRLVKRLTSEVRKSVDGDELRQRLLRVSDDLKAENFEQAVKELEAIAVENPKNLAIWVNLIQIDTRQNGAEGGLKRLAEARRATGDSVPLRLLEARLLLDSKQPDAPAKLAKLESDVDDLKLEQKKQLLNGLGSLALTQQRDPQRAMALWQQAKQLAPDDPPQHLRLFELTRKLPDSEATNKVVAEILERFGKSDSLYAYAQAQLLVDQYQRDPSDPSSLIEARKLVNEGREQRPTWHMLIKVLGEIERLENNATAAADNYLLALKNGPADADTIRKAAQLLMQLNRHEEASETLDLLSGRTDDQLKRLKIESDVVSGNSTDAIASLAEVVSDDSTDASQWLWKGQVLRRLKKQVEAEAAFRRAVELDNDHPILWGALVEQLVLQGKRDEAEKVTREAELRIPEDQSTMFLARCYALLGNYAQAEHYFRAGLADAPDNLALRRSFAMFLKQTNQASKAREVLLEIARTKEVDRANLPHLQWARRELANMIATGGNYARFRQAIQTIENNAVNGALSTDDIRTLANLHGQRGEPSSTRQALAFLEQIAASQSLTDSDKLLKARMLDRTDEWLDARRIMLDVVTSDPTPAELATFARMLIDRNNAGQAAGWVRTLDERLPGAPQVVQLKAEIFVQMGRPDRAEQVLRNWIDAAENDDQKAPRLRLSAGLMEKLEQNPIARNFYDQLIKLKPDSELELAAFEARQGDIGAAFKTLDTRFNKQSAMPILQLGVHVMRERPGDLLPPHKAQIAKWFEQARELMPGAKSIDAEWASYNDLLDNTEETIRVYRKLLKGDLPAGQRGMIANNLAFKLALQDDSLPEALKLVNSAIETLGPAAALLDTRGMIHLKLGQNKEALRDFEDATSVKASPDLYFHLALAYQAVSDSAQAQAALEKAREEGFDHRNLVSSSRDQYDKLIGWLRR